MRAGGKHWSAAASRASDSAAHALIVSTLAAQARDGSASLASIGNGGGTEWLVAQLSPGAECYYDNLGGAYQLIQAGAAIVSAELTAPSSSAAG